MITVSTFFAYGFSAVLRGIYADIFYFLLIASLIRRNDTDDFPVRIVEIFQKIFIVALADEYARVNGVRSDIIHIV